MLNKTGPNIDPWGTPHFIIEEEECPNSTEKVLPEINEANQLRAFPWIPAHSLKRSRRILCTSVKLRETSEINWILQWIIIENHKGVTFEK